ncbi:MAG: cytochrome P450 [Myxococcales bacterium]|nr:cytochrome P450 [Myxococcales bacterium]
MTRIKNVDGFVEVRGAPFVGNFLEAVDDGPGLFLRAHAAHGDRVLMRFFERFEYRSLVGPEDIRHVLVTRADNYVKSKSYDGLKLVLGEGLVTSEGGHWKRQRKLAQPAFQPRSVDAFVPLMAECTHAMLDRWESEGLSRGVVFDLHAEMMRVTLRIIGHAIASVDLDGEARELGGALDGIVEFLNDYFAEVVKLPMWLPLPARVRFKRDLARLDALVHRLVAEHRARPTSETPRDLLDALVVAADQKGAMSDRQLRDEVLTLITAGHETTANALTWTFYLLARHPEIARAVEAEAREVLADGPVTVESLARLELTERVVKESMRLYPPVWGVERENLEDDELSGGARLPKGQTVSIATYALHRMPTLWESPERFDPDRFLPERSAGRHKFAYLPFGAGPRVCLGAHFALQEAKLVLAMIAERHHLELEPGHRVILEPGVTLRPAHGMRMRIRPTSPREPRAPAPAVARAASSSG